MSVTESFSGISVHAGTQDFSVVRDAQPPVSTKDTELHDFLNSIPDKLDSNMKTLNAPSASAVCQD